MSRIHAPHAPHLLVALVLTALAGTLPAAAASESASPAVLLQDLRQNFAVPPQASRPMVRWWWFGPSVVKPEILRELRQMKSDGIGGAELAFVYPETIDDPAQGLKSLPFLSPEMLDAVHYAQAEARKLGLRIDLTLCSGWPYGGPSTTLAEASGRLRTVEVSVAPNVTAVSEPVLAEGESFIAASVANVISRPDSAERTHNAVTAAVDWDAASAQPLTLSVSVVAIPAVSRPRVALFFIASHTGQRVKRASVGAEGWVLDPFSREAVATHLERVGKPLLGAFGSTPPYAIFSDSLEAFGADWTPTLPEEFKKRRGYDLIPHLPELVAGGSPQAETVRHDYGVTLTELVNENYLTQINNWAIAHRTKFRSQTYGEPAVSFSSQNLVGLAEGEGPQWRSFSTLRWATSANHVFDHAITSGESFTWLHSPVFRATPLDMKVEADIDFIMGENQLIFHGWPYSAPQVSEPGWSLYAAAAFNDHNPWHPVMPAVTEYIARMSYLMQQGKPANQVAVLLPTDDAWASFTPSHVSVTGAMQRLISPALMWSILSAGYNIDYIDADAINKIGIHYQILVLPPSDRIPLETLRKIQAYTIAGGHVIAVGRAPSVDPEGRTLAELTTLSNKLFNPARRSLILDPAALAEALAKADKPDLQMTRAEGSANSQIGFIRRKLPFADIYFLVNTGNLPVDGSAAFRTRYAVGEEWSPDTGTIVRSKLPARAAEVRIHLAPYESRVFIFSSDPPRNPAHSHDPSTQITDLSQGWKVTFTAAGISEDESKLTDWTADPATLHYSGEAVYERSFTLTEHTAGPVYLEVDGGTALPGAPSESPEHPVVGRDGLPNPLITRTGPGMHAYYNPPIREAALVSVNGHPAGALWHPPYRMEVGKYLKPGQNSIEIRVYNTALNAWSALPPHNYKPLIERYGDRFQMQDMDKVEPISSGLLGKLELVTEEGAQ